MILVTGAAGRLGRVAIHALQAARVPQLAAGTRDPSRLIELALHGVDVRRIDFDDPSTLESGLSGVRRLLLVSTNAFAEPGRRLQQHLAAVKAAVKAGVEHVVYTSMINSGPESPMTFAPDHRETERAIAASGMTFTFLRNNAYQENLLMDAPAIAQGRVFSSAGAGRISYVSIADTARAAAAAVAGAIPGCFDITGPAGLTIDETMSAVAHAIGRW